MDEFSVLSERRMSSSINCPGLMVGNHRMCGVAAVPKRQHWCFGMGSDLTEVFSARGSRTISEKLVNGLDAIIDHGKGSILWSGEFSMVVEA